MDNMNIGNLSAEQLMELQKLLREQMKAKKAELKELKAERRAAKRANRTEKLMTNNLGRMAVILAPMVARHRPVNLESLTDKLAELFTDTIGLHVTAGMFERSLQDAKERYGKFLASQEDRRQKAKAERKEKALSK